MIGLNTNGNNLVREINLANNYKEQEKEGVIKTTKTASALAFIYERARNAVEFRADHLIRQAAIERILRRRLFLNQESHKIALLLVKELSWAKYLHKESISLSKVDILTGIIEKYRQVLNIADQNLKNTLIGLCSCEIEENVSFNPINQILINFVSSSILPRIDFDENDMATKSMQVYIATERSFAKNNEILISYRLLKVLNPNWKGPKETFLEEDLSKLFETLTIIDNHLNYKYKDLLRRKVSQMAPPFNLIRELVENTPDSLKETISNPDVLVKKATEILEIRYRQTQDKVMRASKRSIIYIFLTKMILAISIEIPFDIIFGKLNYSVLAINILFPPSLMFLLNTGVRLPEKNNTDLIIEKIREYFYLDENEIEIEKIKTILLKGKAENIFYYIFLTTSVLILLGLLWLLNLLHFNPISQIIFLFFLTVVSFFAFRVREISKDYSLKDGERESFFSTLLDYIFLPIIKIGQWLSNQIAKINILSFVFDFIIEAPLKTFLEILEDWLHFVRIKKEEILG